MEKLRIHLVKMILCFSHVVTLFKLLFVLYFLLFFPLHICRCLLCACFESHMFLWNCFTHIPAGCQSQPARPEFWRKVSALAQRCWMYGRPSCQRLRDETGQRPGRSKVPFGKRLHSNRKSSFSMAKSTISMAVFNSYVKLVWHFSVDQNKICTLS